MFFSRGLMILVYPGMAGGSCFLLYNYRYITALSMIPVMFRQLLNIELICIYYMNIHLQVLLYQLHIFIFLYTTVFLKYILFTDISVNINVSDGISY